jgi:hypothetical protein
MDVFKDCGLPLQRPQNRTISDGPGHDSKAVPFPKTIGRPVLIERTKPLRLTSEPAAGHPGEAHSHAGALANARK